MFCLLAEKFAHIEKILPLFLPEIAAMNPHDQLFMQLLYIFHSSAMVALGKLKNPATDKIERNMEQARQSISMLEMIKEKTQGNLSPDLTRILDGFLTELRLNFVDEQNKDKDLIGK